MNCASELRDVVKRDLTLETIRQFGEGHLKVTGNSMLPALWPGDEIIVRRQNISGHLIGQVVLCYRNQTFTAHRLIAKCGDVVITRGDSLSYADPPFGDAEVLGAVVSVVRDGRPVSVPSAWWHPVASWIVQRSELCTRIMLYMQRIVWAN